MRRPTPATTRLRRSPNSCRAKKRCRIVQKKLAPPNKKFRPKARSAVAMCTVDHANLYRSGRIKRMPTEMQEATPAEAGYCTSLRSRCAEIIVAHRTLRDKPSVSPISKSPRIGGFGSATRWQVHRRFVLQQQDAIQQTSKSAVRKRVKYLG